MNDTCDGINFAHLT